MVIAAQYFSLSVGPPAWKPAKPFFLGTGGNICNAGRLGLDGGFSRLPSQAIFSGESSADDTISTASVATICDGAAVVPRRGHPTSTAIHHRRHDIPGGAAERSGSRQPATPDSSPWTAKITDTPGNRPARWPKYLIKAQKFPHSSCKETKEETKGKQHYQSDGSTKFALQRINQGQPPLESGQELHILTVEGIYTGFVMIENKCIEVDKEQNLRKDPRFALSNSSMPNLTALHSTLLHEHHDFFLASQHPTAYPARRRLA
ncbi:telomerase-binding est1a [Trichoderma arundinaceum]|uniref:Telomerase-binding est1a n=1 Tax=Trichoderma arundinaceum TaxID=490622 RepID=A0A395NJL9_TRIAR|nr:telomerase-binding est1a [Trichoderma arundinaceum]